MAFSSRKSATGSFSSSAAAAEVNCDPSLTFDLEDFLMNEAVGGSEIPTFVNIHAPIKEEPEAENEDSHEHVHSPMGLPIPQRNFSESRFSSTPSSLTDGLISSSPSLWGGALRPGGVANFPTTPFNTPIQGTFYHQTDLKGFFTPSSRNPILPVTIKEEVLDLDADLQTMKAVSMFPMEEDDIFQVDKADLIQGPTLAELNANDESLLSDMNFDDFLLPASSRQMADSAESGLALSSQGDRFRMTELNAAFASSPSFSGFELAKAKNNSFTEEELSQLSSSHIGLEFDQSPEAGFVTTNPSNVSMDITDMSNLLSASLPASLSRVSRVSRDEPKVKPPPPYPGTRPKIVPELLPIQSKDTASSSHSPSPTRPPMPGGSGGQWGGARQRTTNSVGILSPGSSLQQRQADCKSPGLAASNPLLLARLSSSAPAPSLLAGDPSLWQRREPRPRLLSTSSLIGEVHGGSTSSISTAGILSPGSFDFSHDEGFDSEEDSDHYEDFDDSDSDVGGSDDESREPRPGSSAGGSTSSKKERYFWQYNVQAKGPKGQKLCVTSTAVDPHVLAEAQDPVFSAYCSVDGIKHSGKARRGDGNDLTPNPRKLHSIGRELDKLNRLINDMTPVSELPVAVRSKSRKEKNKLASRACRLKKKAQHEANKVKLFGLEQEHKKLMSTIHQVKLLLASKCESLVSTQSNQQHQQEITQRIDRVIKPVTRIKIAGHTAEFVNKVLERVKNGEPAGGLDEF